MARIIIPARSPATAPATAPAPRTSWLREAAPVAAADGGVGSVGTSEEEFPVAIGIEVPALVVAAVEPTGFVVAFVVTFGRLSDGRTLSDGTLIVVDGRLVIAGGGGRLGGVGMDIVIDAEVLGVAVTSVAVVSSLPCPPCV